MALLRNPWIDTPKTQPFVLKEDATYEDVDNRLALPKGDVFKKHPYLDQAGTIDCYVHHL